MPGCRISKSTDVTITASQMELAAAPRLSCSTAAAGVLPADRVEDAERLRGEDDLVSDVLPVSSAVAPERFGNFARPGRAAQAGHGHVGGLFVPAVHRFAE
jgi:hypothetical protein